MANKAKYALMHKNIGRVKGHHCFRQIVRHFREFACESGSILCYPEILLNNAVRYKLYVVLYIRTQACTIGCFRNVEL